MSCLAWVVYACVIDQPALRVYRTQVGLGLPSVVPCLSTTAATTTCGEGAPCDSALWCVSAFVMPFDSSRWHTCVMASYRPRATLRPHPRHRWCWRVVWSRMRVAFRFRRWCSVESGARLTKAVQLLWRCLELGCPSRCHVLRALPCDRCAWVMMRFLINQLSPGFSEWLPFLSLMCCLVCSVCVFSFPSSLM